MPDLGKAPPRTEADLRAALAELGQRARSAEDVLSALREPGARQRRRPLEITGGRLRAVGAVAVVAAMAVALPLILSGSPSRTDGQNVLPGLPNPPASADVPPVVVSPSGQLSSASLGKVMLTAFDASADQLAYWTVAGYRAGHLIQLDQSWIWPAGPSSGQVQYIRDASSQIPLGASQTTGSVKLTEDDGYTTVVPRPSRYGQDEQARLIVVCYAGTGQTGCGWGSFDTPAGTWSEHTGVMPYVEYAPSAWTNEGGADLAQQIAQGQWRIVGQTSLRGQQAIELAETPSGDFEQRPVTLWVSTTTYLPLQMVWGPAANNELLNWYYLPPTKSNLAHLRVPIPAGYPSSG
jgi:hypothetical protein